MITRRTFIHGAAAGAFASAASLATFGLAGCSSSSSAGKASSSSGGKGKITLVVKTPPLVVKSPHSDITASGLLMENVAARFAEQYTKADVDIRVIEFDYVDEDKQIVGCFDTENAADVLFEGYFNMGRYIHTGRVVPLDDVITAQTRADLNPSMLAQGVVKDRTYMLPLFSYQNTLCYNKNLFAQCGLDSLIKPGVIAAWSPEEWDMVLNTLSDKLPSMTFPMLMYAKNDQGDTHIMTLLRSKGCDFYDAEGRFAINTPEGIEALRWIQDGRGKGWWPTGCENMEISECNTLFMNGQLAINFTNSAVRETANAPDTCFVNFPSPDGKGLCTSFVSGFMVFDNGDAAKLQAAKDFVSFIYNDTDTMDYGASGIPASTSALERVGDAVLMKDEYLQNEVNDWNFTANNPNWRGVRNVFWPNIHSLLLGDVTPEQCAANIDELCNAEIDAGWRSSKLHD